MFSLLRSTTVALLLFLLALLLLSPATSTGTSDDNHDNTKFVTCGSAIKLTHMESGGKYYLNSGNQNMNSGSGQQLVTFSPHEGKTSSLWWIRESHNDPTCDTAAPLECNSIVRLTHLNTMKNLHTHDISSPLSRQQEVSAFGNDGVGDGGDDWKLLCSNNKKYLDRGAKFRLQHVDTKKFLGASNNIQFTAQNCGGGCPVMNHLEAFARARDDSYGELKIEVGVHLYK